MRKWETLVVNGLIKYQILYPNRFLQKRLTDVNCWLLSQKAPLVWLGSEYTFGMLCQNATGLSKKVQQFKKNCFVIKVQAIGP